MKASNLTEVYLQLRHFSVFLNWPYSLFEMYSKYNINETAQTILKKIDNNRLIESSMVVPRFSSNLFIWPTICILFKNKKCVVVEELNLVSSKA